MLHQLLGGQIGVISGELGLLFEGSLIELLILRTTRLLSSTDSLTFSPRWAAWQHSLVDCQAT